MELGLLILYIDNFASVQYTDQASIAEITHWIIRMEQMQENCDLLDEKE